MTDEPFVWSPERYGEHARFVSDLGMSVVDLLAPRPGERILDLGCGDGALTLHIVAAGSTVVGVDSSPDMVAAARARGLDARVESGTALPYAAAFDAVFSNAALHWMLDLERVIVEVHRSLVAGGRFVGEFGAHGNVATIVEALHTALDRRGISVASPWRFPHPAEFEALLRASGFDVGAVSSFPRPAALPGDVGAWLETLAGPYLVAVPRPERASFVAEVVDALRPDLCDDAGGWSADYVRLRFSATKPAAPD
ncbi:class I SAM-dependent methyltransferase [soil metagenome]